MKIDTLICVLGWEDRFHQGMKIILEKYVVNKVLMISFDDYKSMEGIEKNRSFINELAVERKFELLNINLNYSDSVGNWKILDEFFKEEFFGDKLLINITTFPRETIWTLLFFLKKNHQKASYIYFKPKGYDKDWLTKNHKTPRLLFKHSGIFNLEKPLALFIITGFDTTRLETIIDYYEPSKVVLFCQRGEQYNNILRNQGFSEKNSKLYEKVVIDNYNVTESSQTLDELIKKYDEFNIIMTSQGPKTSAISTYFSYLNSQKQIALVYVPAKDFNPNYSFGLNPEYIEEEVEFN